MALGASLLAADVGLYEVLPGASFWAPQWRLTRTWTAASFPDPGVNPGACGLTAAPGLICDPDRLLTNATRRAIQDRLRRLQEDLGYAVAVVVMQRLDVSSFEPTWPNWPETAVDRFAKNLLRRWRIGDGRKGVMLAVVLDPDYVSVVAERSAEHRGLDTVLCRGIADYGVAPYVDSGHLDRGIVSGIEEIAVALKHPSEPIHPWLMSDALLITCCLVTCLASVICICGCCRDGP